MVMRKSICTPFNCYTHNSIYKIVDDEVIHWGEKIKPKENSLSRNQISAEDSWDFFYQILNLFMTHHICAEDCHIVLPLDSRAFVQKYHEICMLYDYFEETKCIDIELTNFRDFGSNLFENTEYIPVILHNDKPLVDSSLIEYLHPQAISFTNDLLHRSYDYLSDFYREIRSKYSIPIIFSDIASGLEFTRFQKIGAKYFSRAI